ncbi:hypothetical protein [Streptomyces sp. NPDC086023]|uniref:hypothetical protein n=1 Tax=Streptomyces sp. NPDC086023 TaxID=3365746 RepID=UPI0037CD7EC2
MSDSKPTSIKATEATRDRLRLLAQERGTTITELLEELAASAAERAVAGAGSHAARLRFAEHVPSTAEHALDAASWPAPTGPSHIRQPSRGRPRNPAKPSPRFPSHRRRTRGPASTRSISARRLMKILLRGRPAVGRAAPLVM